MIKIAKEVSKTLWAACKLVSFGEVERGTIRGTPADITVLLVLLLVVTAFHRRIFSEGHVYFAENGLKYLLASLTLGAFGLFFGRWLQERLGPFLAAVSSITIVVLVAVAPVYMATTTFLGMQFSETAAVARSDWTWFAVVMMMLVAGVRGYVRAARLFLNDRARGVWFSAMAGLTVTMVANLSFPQWLVLKDVTNPASEESLIGWVGDQFENSKPTREPEMQSLGLVDMEQTYYRQPQLIHQQGRSLHPQRPGVIDLYFVGFAGWGGQNVFMREVIQVRELLNDRFDALGRSAVLINNRDTLGLYPLANRSNLDLLLNEMRDAMDVDEDILMLFLTSHGTASRLSVSFGSFAFDDIRPDDLRSLLDRYGFRNRVLVISSCYSGSFIPDLKDARTMVITAAAADRTSFGCANDREWTYFGDAYFNHALREELSFEQAFKQASTIVQGWEKRDGLTPSRPQIHVGQNISRVLARFVSRLSERATKSADNGHARVRP